jgi:hypothetical protein
MRKNFLGSMPSRPVAGQPEEQAPHVKHNLNCRLRQDLHDLVHETAFSPSTESDNIFLHWSLLNFLLDRVPLFLPRDTFFYFTGAMIEVKTQASKNIMDFHSVVEIPRCFIYEHMLIIN